MSNLKLERYRRAEVRRESFTIAAKTYNMPAGIVLLHGMGKG
jgi:hypothetical protein